MGAVNTTETRAVMLGHTVRILADYDGLKGHYARVLSSGGGQVEVDVHLYGELEPRRVIFLERELVVVPMNDTLRDTGEAMAVDQEVYVMIRRCTDLRMVARHGAVSPLLAERLERRAKRLHDVVRCLQRARAVRQAHGFVRDLGTPCCYALVPVGGVADSHGEHGGHGDGQGMYRWPKGWALTDFGGSNVWENWSYDWAAGTWVKGGAEG
jgi:hypothetical protein